MPDSGRRNSILHAKISKSLIDADAVKLAKDI